MVLRTSSIGFANKVSVRGRKLTACLGERGMLTEKISMPVSQAPQYRSSDRAQRLYRNW
jgi:hypothetical protein